MNWQDLAAQRATLGRPFVMAHRGSSDLLPENSPSAFYRAIADGTDLIETDIHFTRDEAIVLIHDGTLARTTNGHGAIRDMTLAEIKRYQIKQPPERAHVREQILTLPEYIAYTGGKIPTALELKDSRFSETRFAEKLVQTLARYGVLDIFGVISFDLARVKAVQALHPPIATGGITLNNLSPNHPTTFVGPLWPLMTLNPFYVAQAHRLGKMVCPLDPWPDKRVGLYLRLGVDILLTNNPANTLQAIHRVREGR